jgi:hypothetical protein
MVSFNNGIVSYSEKKITINYTEILSFNNGSSYIKSIPDLNFSYGIFDFTKYFDYVYDEYTVYSNFEAVLEKTDSRIWYEFDNSVPNVFKPYQMRIIPWGYADARFEMSINYPKYNLDIEFDIPTISTSYGTALDNQTDYIREPVTFEPVHHFQSIDDSYVSMNYYYDDGFEEKYVTTDGIVTKTKYVITAEWDTTIDNEQLFGRNPYNYLNLTIDEFDRTLPNGEKWTFVDDSGINTDTATNVFDSHPKYTELTYTFMYPSRKPFSAVDGATESNYNKEVNLLITYDNGWNDITTTDKTKMVEAKPYEIKNTDITHEANVPGDCV